MLIRSLLFVLFSVVLAGVVYQATSASARDLFVTREGSSDDALQEDARDNQKEKEIKGSRELFNRSGPDVEPFQTPGLTKKTRGIQASIKIPESWALLDETSRNIKLAETERVVEKQRKLSALISKQNAETQEDMRERMAKQKADERATIGAPPRDADAQVRSSTGAMKAQNRSQSTTNKNVIKRKDSTELGKPRKVFNSPDD